MLGLNKWCTKVNRPICCTVLCELVEAQATRNMQATHYATRNVQGTCVAYTSNTTSSRTCKPIFVILIVEHPMEYTLLHSYSIRRQASGRNGFSWLGSSELERGAACSIPQSHFLLTGTPCGYSRMSWLSTCNLFVECIFGCISKKLAICLLVGFLSTLI